MADYQWLDGAAAATPVASFGIEKVPLGELPLTGGRWLLLSAQAVLDVNTLRVYPVTYHVPQGRPLQGVGGPLALTFSPGRTQYVTFGSSVTLVENGEYVTGLSVVDIPSGVAYGLPLTPGDRRFRAMEDLTPRWFAHYYEWRNDTTGRERLVPRTDAGPLPYAGRLEPHIIRLVGRSNASQYPTMTHALRPASDGLVNVFEQFVMPASGRHRAPSQRLRPRAVAGTGLSWWH
jgi:hypothetical protein